MPSLKAIKTRIGSVKNTQQITRAMKLVAAAKMKKAIDAAVASKPYSQAVTEVLQSLMARISDSRHPLLEPHAEVKTVAVVVISADRGLCGGFNNALLRRVEGWATTQFTDLPKQPDIEWHCYGKKGADYLRVRGFELSAVHADRRPQVFDELVGQLIADLVGRYTSGELDEVYIAYNVFKNTLTQLPTIEKLFPLTELGVDDAQEPEHLVDFVYEPGQQAILKNILPLFLRTRVLQVFLESEAGEHAARMTAMEGATRNATDVIDSLTLQYNRARQAAITNELVEIVAGAEAL